MTEDWPILVSFFPDNWVELATKTDVLKGLRKDKAAENYIRTLLIHLACGYSMRETVVRAKLANIADISDVAFLKRLRKAKDWLHSCNSASKIRTKSSCQGNTFSCRFWVKALVNQVPNVLLFSKS